MGNVQQAMGLGNAPGLQAEIYSSLQQYEKIA